MNLKLWRRRIVSKITGSTNKINKSARVFIPASNRRLIVIPFTRFSIIPVVLLILASGYLLLRSDVFLVKRIAIDYQGGISQDQEYGRGLVGEEAVRNQIEGLVIARSLWSVDLDQVKQTIYGLNKAIHSVEVHRQPLDTLFIKVVERKPVAVITLNRKEITPDEKEITKVEYYLIDEEGEIFFQTPRQVSLPEFSYPELSNDLNSGEEVLGMSLDHGVTEKVVEVLSQINNLESIKVNELNLIDEETVEGVTEDGINLKLSLNKEIDKQIETIELILQNAQLGGKKVNLIDTRFDKIVIRYD